MVLDSGECNPGQIMQRFKMSFGQYNRERYKMQSGAVWQSRFWDHIIRDEADLHNHANYIHYNPVKHGLVSDPFDWKYSSIHRFREQGLKIRESTQNIDFDGKYGE